MRVGLGVNQLHIDPQLIGCFLNAALENVRYAKLLRDLGNIVRFAVIALRGSARNYFQIRDASQARQDFILDALGEIGVVWIVTQVVKRKNGDSVCYHRMLDKFGFPNNPSSSCCQSDQSCRQERTRWISADPFLPTG